MAGLFSGYVVEYPQLRIDCFTTPRRPVAYPPPDVLPPPPPSLAAAAAEGSRDGDERRTSGRPLLELDVFPPASLFLLTHAHSVSPLPSLQLAPSPCARAAPGPPRAAHGSSLTLPQGSDACPFLLVTGPPRRPRLGPGRHSDRLLGRGTWLASLTVAEAPGGALRATPSPTLPCPTDPPPPIDTP